MTNITSITSATNPLIKQITKLKTPHGRKKDNLFICEGLKLCLESITKHTSTHILMSNSFYTSQTFQHTIAPLLPNLNPATHIYTMPDSLFNKCASTDSPQGIITICPPLDIPNHSPVATATLTNAQFILLCDDVADPGNLGTIIRTADSAGVDAIILSNNSADIYNPKTVRSTMGSLFNVPIIRCNLDEFVQNNNKFTYIATSLYNSTDIFSLTLAKNATPALIVGNEANGIHDSLLNIANHKVIIPIYGNAESLNVAVATGIALYQIKSLIKVG